MMQQQETQKITAYLPKALLQTAQEATGEGITETLRSGLESLTREKAYDKFLKAFGTYQFSVSLEELREE